MYLDRVEIVFDAGHRLLDYPGKCASPHGHTYRAEIFVGARALDGLGLARDFGAVRAPLKAWIDAHWDHGFLLNDADRVLVDALRTLPEAKLYLFPATNPTAEAMAERLFVEARRQLGCAVQRVRIWESPAHYAEFIPDEAWGPPPAEGAAER
jgi:6-pyruvoyltetrahydropterin/6-carboxytetrahydropterin synthase